jgi:hypothetical protein
VAKRVLVFSMVAFRASAGADSASYWRIVLGILVEDGKRERDVSGLLTLLWVVQCRTGVRWFVP